MNAISRSREWARNAIHILAIIAASLTMSATVHAVVRIAVEPDAQSGKSGSGRIAKEIEDDLKRLSGLSSVVIARDGAIRLEPNGRLEGGSVSFREFLSKLVNDPTRIFVIQVADGSKDVNFAKADAGTTDLDTGVVYFRIFLDPSDFRSARRYSDKRLLGSFSYGIVIFHEIAHKVSYDPEDPIPSAGVRPDVAENGIKGVIEHTNRIRSELGLPLRKEQRHAGDIYRGPVSGLRNTCSIEFDGNKGQRLVLRWKLTR